jgi:hypothetical protein
MPHVMARRRWRGRRSERDQRCGGQGKRNMFHGELLGEATVHFR